MTVAPTSAHPGRHEHGVRWVPLVAAFVLGGLLVALVYHFSGSSSSTTTGSGVPAVETRNVPAFHAVELAGANNVAIHVGGTQSVVVRADRNLIGRVTTEVHSGTLVVGNTAGSFQTKAPTGVEVTVPTLEALTLSGSGNIVVDGVDTDSLTVSLPGSGTLTANGTATKLDATVGGSGSVMFAGLTAQDVHAVVSGSGTIFVTATGSLDAAVPGSGSVIYAGSPQAVTKSVTGSGTIVGG